MNNRLLILALCLLVFTGREAKAQEKFYAPVTIDENPKTHFAFTKNWAYPWYMSKDDNGKLIKNIDGKITKADKAHLYFTADCKTDVQGGYSIRYCHATRKNGTVTLVFEDGLPAYAGVFTAVINKKGVFFEPKLIYPQFVPGQKNTYQIKNLRLTLNQKNRTTSKVISGFIDAVFLEIATLKDKKESSIHYLRGYFKTPLN